MIDDELHAPWEATYTAAEYRAALAHAHALLEAGKPYATKVFIAGFLRGLYPPREGAAPSSCDCEIPELLDGWVRCGRCSRLVARTAPTSAQSDPSPECLELKGEELP